MAKSGKVLDYINENNLAAIPSPDARVMPENKGKLVYGLSIFFDPENHECRYTDFEKITETVYEASFRAARVRTHFSDYNSGYIKILINPTKSKYDEEGIVNSIKKTIKYINSKKKLST